MLFILYRGQTYTLFRLNHGRLLSEYLSCVRINCFTLNRGRAYAIHHVAKSFIFEFDRFSYFHFILGLSFAIF
jgi:hypothetical protein